MLPFSIFLFLLISATLLAPPPPILVGSFKIPTLRPFQWSSLPTFIPDPDPQSSPEDTALFPLGISWVNLKPLPTQCWPNSTLVANNTVPHSFVRAADDRTGCIAMLLVVLLAMINCFVYWLLVHESHDTEEEFTQSQLSNPAAPPQEPVLKYLEHGSLPYSTKSPSIPSFATTILLQPPAPLGQSLLFPHGLSPDGSAKTTDDDSSPSTLPASSCALIDYRSVSVTQTVALQTPSILFVEPAVRVDDSEVGLSDCTLLDTEVARVATLPLSDLSNIPHPRNLEPSGELQDDSMPPSAIEDACKLDVDEEDVFCYQPSNSEDDGDETLDYKEVDSTPPKTPPAPATEARVLPSPQLRLRSRGHSLDSAPSFSPKKSASEVVNIRLSSPRFSSLLDRTSGGQSEDQIPSITRCASAEDFVSTFETCNAAHASIITDPPSPTFPCENFDDTAHDQIVTTLSSLRADAPVFKPRRPRTNEVVSLESVSVAFEASIHAPRNEEIRRTQGHVEVSDVSTDTPERPIEPGSFQTYAEAVEESGSSGNAQPTKSASPRVTDGLHASIHAPPDASTGTLQVLGDDTENSEEPTHPITRSNSTGSGLYASIHAPAPGQSGQSAQRPSKHHTDVPNWAAICRAEKSSTEGGLLAKCGGKSPDSATALDEDASELSTTTRCATSDQEGSSVDDSDGSSLVHADDQEDTTIDSGETGNTPSNVDAPDEQGFTGTKPPRKSRRRGGRRIRQKIPYFPPPRMQNMQHPVVDARTQGPGQTPNVLPAPAPMSGHHYYTHAPPLPPHHPSAPGHMIPPNGIMHDQFGRYPHYYPSSPQMAPIPGFQPPGPHNPMFYPIEPHPHVSPLAPPTLLYGR